MFDVIFEFVVFVLPWILLSFVVKKYELKRKEFEAFMDKSKNLLFEISEDVLFLRGEIKMHGEFLAELRGQQERHASYFPGEKNPKWNV